MPIATPLPSEAEPLHRVSVDQILHRLREMFGEDRARIDGGRARFRGSGLKDERERGGREDE